MSGERVRVQVRFPARVKRGLEAVAAERGVSLNALCVHHLAACVDAMEGVPRPVVRKRKRRTVSIRLDATLLERVDRVAAASCENRSRTVERMLERWLEGLS